MKKILILLTFSITTFAVKSQDCNGYYPLNEGTTFEITSYSKKDKAESIANNKITSSKDITNGVEATVDMSITSIKEKQTTKFNFAIKCQNSIYYIDLKNMFSSLTSQYKGMDISFDEGMATIPANIKVGDKLEDATMTMNMSTGGTQVMSMIITISDRTVISKESKTTSAGTFDCMILTQNTTIKMGTMMTIKTSSKEWLAKGVGNVRTENYDKNGNLDGYSILTKFSK